MKCSRLTRCLSVADLVGGAERLSQSVVNSGDSGGNTGDELSADTKLSLGEDTGDSVSDRLVGDDAGDNIDRVGSLGGQRASQAGSGGDSEGLALLDSGSLGVGVGVGVGVGARVDSSIEAFVDLLAAADPLPRVTSDGSDQVVAVVKSDVVADTESGSVVEVDNFSTVLLALVVAEDKNRAWLRASDGAFVCTLLDGGRERQERLLEGVAVTLKLGVSVAVHDAVAVGTIGRGDSDMVTGEFSVD